MESTYPIKETVKIITVTKQNQKIHFQIRHPENTEAVIGIAVTSNLTPDITDSSGGSTPPDLRNTSGYLMLSIPQKGDEVYSEDVKLDKNEYSDFIEKAISGIQNNISKSKKRHFYFDTFFPVDKAILEGFYEDVYSPSLYDFTGHLRSSLYQIRIYIRYQVKQPIVKTPTK